MPNIPDMRWKYTFPISRTFGSNTKRTIFCALTSETTHLLLTQWQKHKKINSENSISGKCTKVADARKKWKKKRGNNSNNCIFRRKTHKCLRLKNMSLPKVPKGVNSERVFGNEQAVLAQFCNVLMCRRGRAFPGPKSGIFIFYYLEICSTSRRMCRDHMRHAIASRLKPSAMYGLHKCTVQFKN